MRKVSSGLPARALTAICLVLGAGVAMRPPAAVAQEIDRVVASVDGDPITTHDLKTFSAAAGAPLPDPGSPDADGQWHALLKNVIATRMLEQETKKFQGAVDESQIDAYIRRIEQQHHLTHEQLRAELAREGLTFEDLRKRARQEVEKMMMLQQEVRSKVDVTPGEIKAYYRAHPEEFTVAKERYRLAQVLIAATSSASPEQQKAARAKAEVVRNRALAGDDFAALARQYSDDDSKSKGGELGYFAPDELNETIFAAVRNVAPGRVSEVVHSKYGYHVIKVEEHEVPGVRPLREVSDQIRDKLANQQAKNRFKKWVNNDLTQKHYVETLY